MDETSIQRFRFYMTKLRHTESIPMPLVACDKFLGDEKFQQASC